jgi:hypothetical protein
VGTGPSRRIRTCAFQGREQVVLGAWQWRRDATGGLQPGRTCACGWLGLFGARTGAAVNARATGSQGGPGGVRAKTADEAAVGVRSAASERRANYARRSDRRRCRHDTTEQQDAHIRFASDVLRRLGEELNPSVDQGILELVKNAYDANAKECIVELINIDSPGGSISIRDDGDGMSPEASLMDGSCLGEAVRTRPNLQGSEGGPQEVKV